MKLSQQPGGGNCNLLYSFRVLHQARSVKKSWQLSRGCDTKTSGFHMVISLQHMDIITLVSALLKWKTSANNVKNMTSWQISFTQPGELLITLRCVLDLWADSFTQNMFKTHSHQRGDHYPGALRKGLSATYHVVVINEWILYIKEEVTFLTLQWFTLMMLQLSLSGLSQTFCCKHAWWC